METQTESERRARVTTALTDLVAAYARTAHADRLDRLRRRHCELAVRLARPKWGSGGLAYAEEVLARRGDPPILPPGGVR